MSLKIAHDWKAMIWTKKALEKGNIYPFGEKSVQFKQR